VFNLYRRNQLACDLFKGYDDGREWLIKYPGY